MGGLIIRKANILGRREQRDILHPFHPGAANQPAGGFGGDASDIEIHAREIVKTRERINSIIAQQTGQSVERVTEDTDRDYWMSAEESLDYGLVGRIISSVDELP